MDSNRYCKAAPALNTEWYPPLHSLPLSPPASSSEILLRTGNRSFVAKCRTPDTSDTPPVVRGHVDATHWKRLGEFGPDVSCAHIWVWKRQRQDRLLGRAGRIHAPKWNHIRSSGVGHVDSQYDSELFGSNAPGMLPSHSPHRETVFHTAQPMLDVNSS